MAASQNRGKKTAALKRRGGLTPAKDRVEVPLASGGLQVPVAWDRRQSLCPTREALLLASGHSPADTFGIRNGAPAKDRVVDPRGFGGLPADVAGTSDGACARRGSSPQPSPGCGVRKW